jgi:arabinose-5-phosphate isomerase
MDYLLPSAPLIHGLCVPAVCALDAKGGFDAASQEKLAAFLARGEAGAGAQALFSNGTTGEWSRLDAAVQRRVTETLHYALAGGRGPSLWAGVSAASAGALLQNLEHALKLGAQAAVVAPLAVADVPDPLALFHRHITPLYQRLGKGLPVFLYDNPDEYKQGKADRLRTRQVKQLARLDYVCGVKVTADPKTAGNYLKGARQAKARHEFGVYLGRSQQLFPLFRPASGPLGNLAERWRRFWVSAEPPQGIVPGSGNLFPSAWRQAWAACVAGDRERMDAFELAFRRLHEAFRFSGENKLVACVKTALAEEGVIAGPTLAPGTPGLNAEERSRWLLAYRNAKAELGRLTGSGPAAPPKAAPAAVRAVTRPALLGFGAAVVDSVTPVAGLLAADAKQKTLAAGARHAGGVILNQLAWARALGLSSGLVGASGSGPGAAFLRGECRRLGVETEGWQPLPEADADQARIYVTPKGQRAIYLEPGASILQSPEHAAALEPRLKLARFLVTEVSLLPLASVEAALKLAKAAGRESFLDLDVPPRLAAGAQGLGTAAQLQRCLGLATHVKASLEGARQLAKGSGTALAVAIHKKLKKTPGQWVCVTLGAQGAVGYDGVKAVKQAAFKAKVLDSTGCGDAFHAALIVARSAGLSLAQALPLACAAGAVAAEALGAVPGPQARAAVQARFKRPLPLPELPIEDAQDAASEHLRVALSELGALAAGLPLASLRDAQRLILDAEAQGRRVHVTGVGKCEYVAGFIASSYSSTGTPAFFLHATEAAHGASGQVRPGDVVIAVSNSGETEELKAAVLTLKKNGAHIIGCGGRPGSWLARHSEAFLWAGVRREGDELNLAPRNSVLAEILVLNALGVALQQHKKFTAEQFKAFHPGGSLGKNRDA